MKVKKLIEELKVIDPESRVFILNGDGETVEVEKLYRIEDKNKPFHKQDILLMEKF